MRTLFAILCLAFTVAAHAQDDDTRYSDFRSWGLYPGDTPIERYIFADTAYVRISPDTKQPPLDTLFAGDNIQVAKVEKQALTIRGMQGPWLAVYYTKNGSQKTGYIWQGLVSCMPLRRGDIKYVYAPERKFDSTIVADGRKHKLSYFLMKLKVVQNGQIIAKASFATPDDESANWSEAKIMSGMGLTNVQQILVFTFSGEACGIPTMYHYLAFTKNNQLVQLPGKMTVGDAGVYYHDENFTFPNEKNGKPDMIFWNSKTEESNEKKLDKNGEPILEVTEKKSRAYTWDGTNLKVTEVKK
ncbi:hypothetical protein HHL16_22035 [Pseudoflavitalea sp. G-6-1-2]|uniref:hypothetical protein n=1 Tax=Pseudoflavitalea sp. G-6-1-2 TaxID=2728841 RepID=UPI00146E056D|nr:hypothetical protein [Pseudoflavitalea sp. G-6-1-2]NML23575.1 hypothetical protein [Pseudoflavitalea sp. G-6-1-2]